MSINVDGLGNYDKRAARRMDDILRRMLMHNPSVLLFQEVIEEMYAVIKSVLHGHGWSIYRLGMEGFPYFLVSAVKDGGVGCKEKARSTRLPCSDQGRALLTVPVGDFEITNLHLESGQRLWEKSMREQQMRQHAPASSQPASTPR